MTQADWIAVDWGTSRLRAWLMLGPDMIEARTSDAGMGGLAQEDFAPALAAICDGWPDLPVVACGMVGSRQGWVEAPYAPVPCPPPGAAQAVEAAPGVHILPGVSQANPADVMRGEETQIAGLLQARPDFDGVVCLPGTHTKWVHVSAGEIVSFQTFITGEVFRAICDHTVLRHSTAGGGWDDAAFSQAVADAMSHPARVAARLFGVRAEGLLSGLDADVARARLSGLLIGLELGGARPFWLGQHVVIIGTDAVAAHYQEALKDQGVEAVCGDADTTTRAGLWAARKAMTCAN